MVSQSDTAKGRAKRERILEAARAAFLAGGFHATSMQDLFRATDTSPGAFYRYFPAKEALVRALSGEAIARIAATIGATLAAEPRHVADALAPVLLAIDELERTRGGARLALLVWAEAQRDGELARVARDALLPALDAIGELAATLVARNVVPGTRDSPNDVAATLAGILQGYVVQRALFGVAPAVYEAGLRGITGGADQPDGATCGSRASPPPSRPP